MNNTDQLAKLRGRGLLPFQAEFVLEFLKLGSDAVWEFASPVGTGKTLLSVEIVRRIVESQARARVLVFVPKALGMQWTDRLTSAIPDTQSVDRRKLMELEAASVEGHPLWPARAILVMSIDFAKREDVLSALQTVEWDLLVADESHLLAGKRADAFFSLVGARRAKRALMLTSLPSAGSHPKGVAVSRRAISLQDIVDWQGRPIFERVQPAIEFVMYHRDAEELAVLRALEVLAGNIAKMSPALQFHARLLVRAASSSFYAAERVAWRLRGALAHMRNLITHGREPELTGLAELEGEFTTDVLDTEVNEAGKLPPQAIEAVSVYIATLDEVLVLLQDIPNDTKLQTLMLLLGRVTEKRLPCHVCIWTQFQATAQYLAPALERLGVQVFRLAASMELDARATAAARFKAEGGVLLTNGPAMEGVDLPFVDECIHYDLPIDPRALEQRVARFVRFGRTKPFHSIVLRDVGAGLTWEEELIAKLKPWSALRLN